VIISDKKNFFFVHVPKTGGSTLSRVLSIHANNAPIGIKETEVLPKWYGEECMCSTIRLESARPVFLPAHHPRLKDIRDVDLSNYFKFAFVRNPFDRIVSTWENPAIKFRTSFEEFIERNTDPSYKKTDWLTQTQSDILVCKEGYTYFDYVGKYESLEEDFEFVRNKLDIPKKVFLLRSTEKQRPVDYDKLPIINNSQGKDHGNYREYFNDRTRGLVERYYEKDLEIFEYEF